jgi:hypothetical protein
MNYIEREIEAGLQRLGVAHASFVKLGADEAAVVAGRAQATFVNGNPRVWWLSLMHPKEAHYFADDSGSEHLLDYVPVEDRRCWFIPETGEMPMAVYDAQVDTVFLLVAECFFFEYNMVGPDFDWILIENDHKEIIFSQVPSETAENGNRLE